jgi:uncharacterized protein
MHLFQLLDVFKGMKRLRYAKQSCLFFICAMLLLFVVSPALAERAIPKNRELLVNDFANVIPQSYEQQIQLVTQELLRKTEIPVVIVTMPDIGGAEYNDYANRLYEEWGIGKKGVDKGVLLFVTVKERKMRIEVGYGLEGILTDGMAGDIRDNYMVPFLRNNKYGEGLLNGTLAVAQIISKDAGVQLTGQAPVRIKTSKKRGSALPFLFIVIFFLLMSFSSRRRGGSWWILPLLFLGGGGGRGGGGFGGFSGGFGGFGGGMSGGGGAGGGF